MAKKSSKRSKSKAKKPGAAASRQKVVDAKKDFYGDYGYSEHIELQKEIDEDIRQRLSRRPVEMQRKDFRLPESLEYFLFVQFQRWIETQYRETGTWKNDPQNATEAAYMEGCRQGFIEGFVARLEPDRKRSAAGNAGKRTASVKV